MKPFSKNYASDSSKESRISELQEQKQQILRDIQEREHRKKREQEYKNERVHVAKPIIVESNHREKTPPVVKKVPKLPAKTFKEILEEAEKRSKENFQNSEKDKLTNTTSSGKKRSANDQMPSKFPDIPRKKPKVDDRPVQKSIDISPKPINSAKMPRPINSFSKMNSQPTKHNSQTKVLSNQNNSKLEKNGILTQNRPNSLKPSSTGILAQSSNSFSKTSSISSNDRFKTKGNLAHSNQIMTSQTSSRSSKVGISSHPTKPGIMAQSGAKINAANISQSSKINNSIDRNPTKRPIVGQKSTSNQIKPKPNPSMNNRGICVDKLPQHRSQNSQYNKSSNCPQSRGIAAQNGARGMMAQSAGICAQNLSQYNKPSNYPQARGIAAQNGARGMMAQSAGICAQNLSQYNKPSNYPQARGITAQNGTRGIMAQSGRIPSGNNYSASESEDDYDPEMSDFIDDSQGELTEDMIRDIYGSLNHDPSKYAKVSRYDDCNNMVSNFNDITKEESRSARIGREEDLREMREEEMRLQKKKKIF